MIVRLRQWLQHNSFLASSGMLFVSMTVVNAGNYLFNLLLGRWLGPEAFADLTLIVTLMLIVTLVTSALQLIGAKFAAVYAVEDDRARLIGLRRWLGRWALGGGLAFFVLFTVGAPFWQRFFHTVSAWPFVILAIGLPVYFLQGVDRGILQGQTRFGLLALSYQAEMWLRLVAAVVFVALGWAVNGAVGGLTVSFIAAWLVARRAGEGLTGDGTYDAEDRRVTAAFALPAIAALVGQILINNSDILIVKHFFVPEDAGQYAALALIGRVVFFATWSVVATLFPVVAQRQQRGERHRHLLWLSLGLVLAVSVVIIGGSLLLPEVIVSILFGEAYLSIAPLLWLYAVATMFYALSNVIVNYRLSIGSGRGSVLVVAGGVLQVLSLWLFHSSLQQVVLVQIGLMGGLFAVLLAWDALLARQETQIFALAGRALTDPERLTIPATTAGLAQLGDWLAAITAVETPAQQARLALAVHEVCLYVIQHGYRDASGSIEVAAGWLDGSLYLRVQDRAPHRYTMERPGMLPANPLDLPDFGWSMFIVHEVMEDVIYQGMPDGSRWLLRSAPPAA